jgi:hypothetical protein
MGLVLLNVLVFFLSQQNEQSRSLSPGDRGTRKPPISLYVPITEKYVHFHSSPPFAVAQENRRVSLFWKNVRFAKRKLTPGTYELGRKSGTCAAWRLRPVLLRGPMLGGWRGNGSPDIRMLEVRSHRDGRRKNCRHITFGYAITSRTALPAQPSHVIVA